jgi:hypothetical protein
MVDIGRRSVLGAAWAAPVIAVAMATPAHAASLETLTAYAVGYDGDNHPIRVYVTVPSTAAPGDITLVLTPEPPDEDALFQEEEFQPAGWVAVTSGRVTVVETTAPPAPGSTSVYEFSYYTERGYVLVSITVQYPGYPDVQLTARTSPAA